MSDWQDGPPPAPPPPAATASTAALPPSSLSAALNAAAASDSSSRSPNLPAPPPPPPPPRPPEDGPSLADALALDGAAPLPVRPPPPPLPTDVRSLQARVLELEVEATRLATTLAHYRQNAAQVQARYHLYNPDVARPSRRVYVGGLPMGTNDAELKSHVNSILNLAGGAVGPGSPVSAVTVYPDRAYAFMEMRSVEEASNVMALDGVPFREGRLRVRRPNNYDASAAALLGPTEPDPGVDAARLGAVRTTVPDTPDKLFVGGLPCDWDAGRVKALLAPYGRLVAFNLVMDKTTGNSRGYAFAEFADRASGDYAIASLHGSAVGPRLLTVKRALEVDGL